MADREKVRNGLRCLSGDKEMVENPCAGCGYTDCQTYAVCVGQVATDALELLKPVKPIRLNHTQHYQTDNYRCGICGDDMYYEQHFCESCGTEAKWDA